jgi:hypothetical protein
VRIPRIDVDFEHQSLSFHTTERVHTARFPPSMRDLDTTISRAVLDVEADELVVTLPGGVEAMVELGVAGARASDPLGGRRVVYLDQNRWSAMAAWRHRHRPISPPESDAAERLHALVTAGEIVLPMSGGHAVETSPLYDQRRVALASTLLELSRGWHVRNPVEVRREELENALAGQQPVASPIACLGSDVLFTQRLDEVDVSDLPALMAAAVPRVVNVMSLYEALLDTEALDNVAGSEAASRWAQKFAEIGERLRQDGASRELVQRVAHANVLLDLHPEIASLTTTSGFDAWLPRAEDDFSRMPYLSRYRAVIFARLRNSAASWTGNDLTDLNFLCCAAGYADVVVGERRTIGDLRTARGVPQGAALACSLSEAVAILDAEPAVGVA